MPEVATFGEVRFPFTFMGLIALAFGAWAVAYLSAHQALDTTSRWLVVITAAGCFVFALYVLVRRIRRGPEH